MPDLIANIFNLALVMFGFGLVVFWHELGHFLAARWAGIRVHTFAVGFGQAIFSYRKGMGFRGGSTEPEYRQLLQREKEGISEVDAHAISPTEYRLNWFPLGGYVKMHGQDDLDASDRSDDPDSYQSAKVWKRMIVISAGVIMNLILGAIIFMGVYMVGKDEPPAIIGTVIPESAAETAGLEP
ncbi:MAG: site-2 protease family protein, partial [Planctomycetota bacterium]